MQFETGMIVRSRQGRDKGRFYMVSGVKDGLLLLIDGSSRTAAHPKRKNPVHTAPTKTVLPEGIRRSDSEIRKILAAFYDRAALPKEVM